MLIIAKILYILSSKYYPKQSSNFVKYSSYFALVIYLFGVLSPIYAMEEDDKPISIAKIKVKASKPTQNDSKIPNIIQDHSNTSYSYDQERSMYYYGKSLSTAEKSENEPLPIDKDENAVIFALAQVSISDPSITSTSLINFLDSPEIVEKSDLGIIVELKEISENTTGGDRSKRKRGEQQTSSKSENVNTNDNSQGEFSFQKEEGSPDHKREKFIKSESTLEEKEKEEKVLSKKDRRIKVTTPGIYPWSVHGHMRMEFLPSSVYIGSGTLIGDKYVITAAHNLFDRGTKTSVKKLQFFPGKEGTSIPYESPITHFAVHPDWYNSSLSDDKAKEVDIGVVKLKEPLGNFAGFYGYREFDENELKNKKLNITGYPGEYSGKHMYTMEGYLKKVDDHRIYYDIDTSGGQSGSGVWVKIQDPDDNEESPYVVGVHAYGSVDTNSGTRLTHENAEKLKIWLEKLETKS